MADNITYSKKSQKSVTYITRAYIVIIKEIYYPCSLRMQK